MRTRARGIADFRNDTGQPASAFGGVVGLRIEDRVAAGPSRLRPARAGRTNKPNSRPGRVGRGPGGEGSLRKTNPVSCRGPVAWGRRGVRRGANAPNKPNFPSSKTNGKCFEDKELWLFVPTRGLGKTNPIPGGVGHPSPAPRPSGRAPGREAVVQTKPIPATPGGTRAAGAWDQGQMRQTNPISGGAKRRAKAWRKRSYGE
jgi:hypothetical protein